MKTRNGFISNSSSASFVIPLEKVTHLGDNKTTRETLLSQEEIDLLIGYRFWKSCNRDPFCHPSDWGYRCDHCEGNKNKELCTSEVFGDMYLRYDISCNEDEPIQFLLEHDIPFYAGMNYNGQLMVYKKGMKKVLILQNEGIKYIWGMMYERSNKYFKKTKFDCTCDSDQCSDEYKTIEYVTKKDALGA